MRLGPFLLSNEDMQRLDPRAPGNAALLLSLCTCSLGCMDGPSAGAPSAPIPPIELAAPARDASAAQAEAWLSRDYFEPLEPTAPGPSTLDAGVEASADLDLSTRHGPALRLDALRLDALRLEAPSWIDGRGAARPARLLEGPLRAPAATARAASPMRLLPPAMRGAPMRYHRAPPGPEAGGLEAGGLEGARAEVQAQPVEALERPEAPAAEAPIRLLPLELDAARFVSHGPLEPIAQGSPICMAVHHEATSDTLHVYLELKRGGRSHSALALQMPASMRDSLEQAEIGLTPIDAEREIVWLRGGGRRPFIAAAIADRASGERRGRSVAAALGGANELSGPPADGRRMPFVVIDGDALRVALLDRGAEALLFDSITEPGRAMPLAFERTQGWIPPILRLKEGSIR